MIKKLILGTVQLGLNYGINNSSGKPSLEKAFKILHTAYDNELRILDTAEAYGDSQEVIGEFQKQNPNKKFKIITKLSANRSFENINLIDLISEDCKILNTDKLYGYMFHNYQSFKENESLYESLLLAKENGLIEKAGISLYSNIELIDIIENYTGFDLIQIPFNLFDNALKRRAVLEKAKAKGVEIHTRSAFLQGVFFMQVKKLPLKLHQLLKELNSLNSLKKKYDINTETLALKYALEKQYIDNVLIGVDTVGQLLSNIEISKSTQVIPHELVDRIDIKEEKLLNPSNW